MSEMLVSKELMAQLYIKSGVVEKPIGEPFGLQIKESSLLKDGQMVLDSADTLTFFGSDGKSVTVEKPKFEFSFERTEPEPNRAIFRIMYHHW